MNFGNDIADVPGIRVGHADDERALTGCTVILCEAGAIGGIDQRGGAPGTRETDLLRPLHMVEKIHAVLLTGGSAFGLDAAGGVMRYLEEQQVGFDTGFARVPIVPAAVIFDLGLGNADIRPDASMGYQACQQASKGPIRQGNVGAGMGASVGKILGMSQATKSGMGSISLSLSNGLVVGALMVVNAFGEVVDPNNGNILAGVRIPGSESVSSGKLSFTPTLQLMEQFSTQKPISFNQQQNTVIGVVATNAALTKEQANLVAQMAQDGIARCIRPAHTLVDGDTLFALSTVDFQADVNLVGALAVEAVSLAILQAVKTAGNAAGLPGLCM
jgi:L-aminopeptidase/D-esterase-like protein